MDEMNQYGLCHEIQAPPAAKLLYCYLHTLAGGQLATVQSQSWCAGPAHPEHSAFLKGADGK